MATLTTVGYGDITAHENSAVEIIFATVILVIGTAIYTMVIALLEDIVSQLDVTSSLHNIKMNKLKLYFQSQSVPDALKTKIITYYDVLWRTQKGVSGKKILTFLGHSIRSDVTLNMLTPLLGKTFYLKDCSTEFVLHLLDKISLEIYLPGDTIYHEGEKCDSLFFVYKGEVDLFTSKNVKFKKISDCVLGEASFFGLEPHICTAKSFEICEIFLLNLEDFVTCLNDNCLVHHYFKYVEDHQGDLLDSKRSMTKVCFFYISLFSSSPLSLFFNSFW